MKNCLSCGMPLEKKEDFALGDEKSEFCLYCVKDNGEVKSVEEVFEGGVQFFLNVIGGNRELAEKLVRKNMNSLPYWQENNSELLQGVEATDSEFAEAMKKLA